LKNSLQYCDAAQAGCHEYALASSDGYSILTGNVDWTKNSDSIFLNKNAVTCDQSSEGCHQFLRFTSGLGTNLIINSDFSSDLDDSKPSHWPADVNAKVTSQAPALSSGGNAVQINSNSPEAFYSKDWSSNVSASSFPQGFVMEPEVSYTFTADVYLQTGDSVIIGIGRQWSTWQDAKTTTA